MIVTFVMGLWKDGKDKQESKNEVLQDFEVALLFQLLFLEISFSYHSFTF